jgi:uncharacterized protein (TIGR00375 family)
MPFIADLHIHSSYSRATSPEMTPESLYRWAQLKGIRVVGTGDFTHPKWFSELQEKLEPAEPGLFRLRPEWMAEAIPRIPDPCRAEVRFLLTVEISGIYGRQGRTRKVHNLIFVPDFAVAARINGRLRRIGNLMSDGRPILGLDSEELLRIVLDEAPEALLIPAHAWTPHFSVFGANSGFDSLEECFGDLTPHIRAIETGLSSDPSMNRRLSRLDNISLISNSDAHSPGKLGREANILKTDLSYQGIVDAIVSNDPTRFLGTIEFFPEEGKYHYDGHRACGARMSPSETLRRHRLCPQCGKPVTVGVLHRVEALADRPEGFQRERLLPYRNLIPLVELLAEVYDMGPQAKTVTQAYFQLLEKLGNEFSILMDRTIPEIETAGGPVLAEAIRRMREGEVSIAPGYDGEYGTIRIFSPDERRAMNGQMKLF